MGIVPIENSSGGTIYETVDRLVEASSPLFIKESLSINVKLALLGKTLENIKIVYSHFAALRHCENWLQSRFPDVELCEEKSTATAAQKASKESGSVAIGTRESAEKYQLNILEFPIEEDFPNVTQFFVVGHENGLSKNSLKTSFVVVLPNKPGSLVNFLEPFKDEDVNLSRIISRPQVGKPENYIFLVDIVGTEQEEKVKSALKKAQQATSSFKNIGSYPVIETYES